VLSVCGETGRRAPGQPLGLGGMTVSHRDLSQEQAGVSCGEGVVAPRPQRCGR
jgi:hypothetical protein